MGFEWTDVALFVIIFIGLIGAGPIISLLKRMGIKDSSKRHSFLSDLALTAVRAAEQWAWAEFREYGGTPEGNSKKLKYAIEFMQQHVPAIEESRARPFIEAALLMLDHEMLDFGDYPAKKTEDNDTFSLLTWLAAKQGWSNGCEAPEILIPRLREYFEAEVVEKYPKEQSEDEKTISEDEDS